MKVDAQVLVTATNGALSGTYTTLRVAFDSINTGFHRGDIIIEVSASTNEGAIPATLLSGDADPTSYSSIYIYPVADGVSISGAPGAGFGVIQLNGADNVIIDGDNPLTGGINRNLTVVNTNLTSLGYSSCLRVAALAGPSVSADNIFIFNTNFNGNVTSGNASGITGATTSSNTSFGLYFGGKGSATTTLGAITSETADAALTGTTINNIVIDNIAVNQCARGIAFNGAASTVNSSLSITNSVIGAAAVISGYPVTAPATTVYTKGIWVAGADNIFIGLNTIQNVLSYVGTTSAGIELAANIGTGVNAVSDNTITGVVNNAAVGTANGILISAAGNSFAVSGNTVSNVQSGAAATVSGININTTGAAATVSKNKVSAIYNRNGSGNGAAGISFSAAFNNSEISNNFIFDVFNTGTGHFTTSSRTASGIYIGSGTSHRIYHNSVHLSGISAATATNMIACLSVSSSAITQLDIRNNIFSNTVTGGAANSAHVGLYLPLSAVAATGYRINNNAYYTGSTAGLSGMAFAGASSYNVANLYTAANFNAFSSAPATNFRSWSSVGTDNNDVHSFASTAAAPFVSATDLHIVAGVTQLESGGVTTSVTQDIDNAARAGFPDIGADEFAGTISDQSPPLITYPSLAGTCGSGAQVLTANIKDPSGVPTSGAGLPVLYWRRNALPYAAVTGVSLGGGNYSFTFGATALLGETVSYYIVAQDGAGTPNVISSLSVGAGGFTPNVPTAATPPTAPENYLVQSGLAPGTYTVGVTGNYASLTAAINAYNTSCLSGPIEFQLIDPTYTTPAEVYPITIFNPQASAANTLLIRPAAGINASVTGASATALIKFNGADYITIDGSNNGTTSQNLTFTNTDASTTSAVIWMASSGSNGATNNIIKNCFVIGNTTTTTYAGIFSGSGSAIGTQADAANSSNTYQNIIVRTAFRGLALMGPTGGDNNTTVTECTIGSTTPAQKIGFRGLLVFNQNNVTVTQNDILGITSTVGSRDTVAAGISVRGAISNGVIAFNNISDCKHTSAAGWTVHGITLQSSSVNSGLSVHNNFIYDIAGFGYNPVVQDNGFGIGIMSGGGYKIYYNSINLTTNQSVGQSAAIIIDNRSNAATTPLVTGLDIRNNIFANSQTANTRYSIYSLVPETSFTNINYNDYYSASSSLGFLGGARNTLAAWQSATLADANSVSVIPDFTSATNLHLLGSSTLNGLATPIAGFIVDIDGDIRNATTPDIGADEFTPPACGGAITAGAISASKTTLCVSEDVTFSASGFTFGTGMTYVWQTSPDNSSWSPILGQTNPLTATITISTDGYYRLSATCSNNATTAFSSSILVTVNSPAISASAGGSVCGLGTVNLTATATTGTLRWFDVPTGGVPLGTGSPYTTPVINTTTNYYVEAIAGLSNASVGPLSPVAQGGTIQTAWTVSWELYFDVVQSTQLLSVDVYPWTSGQTSTINIYNAAGTIIGSQSYTTTVSGGATAQTVTFAVPVALVPGSGYYIYSPSFPSGGLTRNNNGSTYPYTSSAINITGNDLGPGYYMYYYNVQFVSGCASPRTTVVATVSAPPVFTHPTASATAICGTGTSNLTSFDSDYSTYSWVPTLGLSNPNIANPVASPTESTTYTVTVGNGTCSTSDTVQIVVQPTPSALTIVPAGPVAFCDGGAAQLLTASGGSGFFFTENFNSFPISKFVVTGTGVTENQSSTYYFSAGSSVRLTHVNSISNASPASYELTNGIDMTQYSNAVLTFRHICALENTGSADWDFGYVEYSTDDGTNWTPFPQTSYTGSGTLRNGVVCFEKTSYSDWNTQFTNAGSTPGAGPATSLWKLETLDLSPWQGSTQFKVRFRIKSDFSEVYYGWLIDDVRINSQATITWSPTTELFTNAGGTINYTGTNRTTVYTKPTASRTYTATAAFGACPVTANVDIALTSNPISITIAAAPSTTICQGDTTDLTIAAQNIQGSLNPLYTWRLNGTTITGSATGGSSVGTTITVASTATLYPGMAVTVTAGTGAFALDSRIVNILSPTQFTVTANPITGLSGATITATASGRTVTSLRFGGLVNGDVLTCVLAVGGVTCIPTNPVTSNSIAFTVTPGVATSVSIGVSPATTACAGENVTFTATPVNGGAAPTYEWFVNGVSQGTPSVSNTFVTTTLTTGQTVTCRMASNAINCPFPKAPFSNAIVMTINPSFPVSVSITSVPAPIGSTISICNGTSVTFTATPTNGGVTPLYEWFVNGVSQGAPSGTNTFVTTTLADLDDVTCELTSSISSCALGNPATSNIIDVSVTTQPASVTITPATATCAGTSKIFTANPVNGGGTPTYQWYVNSSPVGTGLATYTYTPVNGDVVEVEMSSSLSCAVPIPALGTLTQTVNAIPTAAITGNNILCPGIPNLLNSNATAGSGTITSYQWRLGGSNIPGATNATYTATAVGNYDVVITNSNTCAVTSAVFTITAAATPLAGTYYIGRINAANVNGAGTTLTTTSTANLVVGALLTRVTGAGTFAANTIVTSIIDATTFTISNTPTVALVGAGIGGADCDDYLSFATAIADLNLRGISNNCVFNVLPGYVENATAHLALGNATLNPTVGVNTIVFQKNGVGVNPIINAAYAGAGGIGGAIPDGIWSINGTNNVTIDGIDLNDNNTLNATVCMDYGYGLFKLNSTDGAQNNTITNCTITLKRLNNAGGSVVTANTPGSNGIIVLNSIRTAATTALAAGGAIGANSNNKFYSNTIQNCNNGIALSGLAAASPFTDADTGNDIGGASAATGNTIINYGGGAAATQPAAAVVASNQWSINISYNTINNNDGGGVNHITTLRGIYGLASTSASATINNNNITLNGGGTNTGVTGIDNAIGSTAAANTISINNNTVTGSYTTATTGAFTGIVNSSTAATVNLNGNTVQNITLPGSGAFLAISNSGIVPTALNINNNIITGNTKSAGTVMTLIAGGSPAATATTAINSNTITNNTMVAGATNPTLLGIQLGGSSTYTINTNTIDNLSVTGLSGAATTIISGISNIGGNQNETVSNNIISNLFVTGTSTAVQTVRGIHHNTTNASTRTVSLNTIFNVYSSAALTATVTGINSQAGGTVTITRNRVYNLFPGQSATIGSIARGISVSNGGPVPATSGIVVSNNMIALDLTLAASATGSVAANSVLTGTDALRGIEVTSVLASSSLFLYYNSIRLAGNGAGNFGSSGVFATANATATTVNLTMINNLVVNEATANGTGLTVAYRRSAGAATTLNNFNAASNNNMFYAGTPSASRLIYADGVSTAQTITAYTAGVFTAGTIAPRESASLSDIINFVSQTDLHVNTADNCALNNTGIPVAAVTVDYDAEVRSATTPDIGADEFVGTGAYGTWAGINTNWNDPQNWCGGVPTATTSVIIPSPVPNYPVIPAGTTAVALNITIDAGANITTTGTGILNIKGTLTNNGILNNWGELQLTGAVAQTFPGTGAGTINAMTRLTIANTSGANPAVTINGDLLIREAITPTQGIVNLNNAYVTLRSVSDTTARIGQVGGSFTYTGTGNFVVERYFPGRRAWRLINAPVVATNARSVFHSWQAGGNTSISGNATYVTGPAPNLATNGLDLSNINNHSLRRFNYLTSGFDGINNTRTTRIPGLPAGAAASFNQADSTGSGHFIFVRGDRTPSNPDPFNTSVIGNATVLRDTGTVKTGAYTYTCYPGSGLNIYSLIGNPYASAIDFTQLTRSGTVLNRFRVWDPTISTVGAWVIRDVAAGNNIPASPNVSNTIQSKQAFVVETSGGGATVTFNETAKSSFTGQSLLFRPAPLPAGTLSTSLFFEKPDGTDQLADGVLVQFNNDYSVGVDQLDAVKFTNVNETFSIKEGANNFMYDCRPFMHTSDTLFFNLARMRQFKYKFSISIDRIMQQHNRVAYLEDKFLHTSKPLNMNGNTRVDFEVTGNSASAAADRFFITFKKLAKFKAVAADAIHNDVTVNWSVENAEVVNLYEIERSVDGKQFEKVGEVLAGSINSMNEFNFIDPKMEAGYYYYRVKALSTSFAAQDYSDVVKVKVVKSGAGMYVYPNPVTNGVIGLRMPRLMPEGRYSIRLIDADGKAVQSQQLQHVSAVGTEMLSYPTYLAAGTYQMEVVTPDKTRVMLNVIIQKQ